MLNTIMKRLLLIVAAIVAMGSAAAQQNLWKSQNVVSPEIGDDGRVTFRLYAPEAKSVEVAGDFLAPGVESASMTRSEDGLWSYTTEPLESEMYYYSLRIDGMRDINDPSNPYLVRDVATQMNYFIIGGTRGDLYMAQDVKHGTVWWCTPLLATKIRAVATLCSTCFTVWVATRRRG